MQATFGGFTPNTLKNAFIYLANRPLNRKFKISSSTGTRPSKLKKYLGNKEPRKPNLFNFRGEWRGFIKFSGFNGLIRRKSYLSYFLNVEFLP